MTKVTMDAIGKMLDDKLAGLTTEAYVNRKVGGFSSELTKCNDRLDHFQKLSEATAISAGIASVSGVAAGRHELREEVNEVKQQLADFNAISESSGKKQAEDQSKPSWVRRAWSSSVKGTKHFLGSTKLAAENMFDFGSDVTYRACRDAQEAWYKANNADPNSKGSATAKEHLDKLKYELNKKTRSISNMLCLTYALAIGSWNTAYFTEPMGYSVRAFTVLVAFSSLMEMSRATEDVFLAFNKTASVGGGLENGDWAGSQRQAAVITYVVKLGIHGSSVYLGMARMFGPGTGLAITGGVVTVSLAVGYGMYRNQVKHLGKKSWDRPVGVST